jgi:hypothetical protein
MSSLIFWLVIYPPSVHADITATGAVTFGVVNDKLSYNPKKSRDKKRPG